MPIPQTVAIRVVGPYRGTRISGTSEDVDDVRLSRSYLFDDFEVRIDDIPAKRDNHTGRLYVSAAIA